MCFIEPGLGLRIIHRYLEQAWLHHRQNYSIISVNHLLQVPCVSNSSRNLCEHSTCRLSAFLRWNVGFFFSTEIRQKSRPYVWQSPADILGNHNLSLSVRLDITFLIKKHIIFIYINKFLWGRGGKSSDAEYYLLLSRFYLSITSVLSNKVCYETVP